MFTSRLYPQKSVHFLSFLNGKKNNYAQQALITADVCNEAGGKFLNIDPRFSWWLTEQI